MAYGEQYTWHGSLVDVVRIMRDVPAEEYKKALGYIVNWFSEDVAGHNIWRIGPDEYVIQPIQPVQTPVDNIANGG